AVDRLAALSPLSRWRETRRRARFAYAGAVLQFPRLEIQPEHGADAAVGGHDAMVPALVRDPARAGCGARWRRCRGMHVRQILVDRPAARTWPRCAPRPEARDLFPLGRALGDDRGRDGCARAARSLDRR